MVIKRKLRAIIESHFFFLFTENPIFFPSLYLCLLSLKKPTLPSPIFPLLFLFQSPPSPSLSSPLFSPIIPIIGAEKLIIFSSSVPPCSDRQHHHPFLHRLHLSQTAQHRHHLHRLSVLAAAAGGDRGCYCLLVLMAAPIITNGGYCRPTSQPSSLPWRCYVFR